MRAIRQRSPPTVAPCRSKLMGRSPIDRAAAAADPRPIPKNLLSPRTTLIVSCLSTAMLMLDVAVVNTAIAQLGRHLRVGASSLKWIVDAYTLPIAATVITVARSRTASGDGSCSLVA